VLSSLSTKRRLILSGTPIQNDLAEFYAMANWVNPGALGSFNEYKGKYITPITSQDPRDEDLGIERLKDLTDITRDFILRRTCDVNSKYLPPKREMVLFVRMNESQAEQYEEAVDVICAKETQNVFVDLGSLRKVANYPGESTKDFFCSGNLYLYSKDEVCNESACFIAQDEGKDCHCLALDCKSDLHRKHSTCLKFCSRRLR
jgi:SNF2 family DNA or RNA helicase